MEVVLFVTKGLLTEQRLIKMPENGWDTKKLSEGVV